MQNRYQEVKHRQQYFLILKERRTKGRGLETLIVGNLINIRNKEIKQAVLKRDQRYLQEIARGQMDAGAQYIDVNCGTQVEDEIEVMKWLVNTIQEAVEIPLCLSSPDVHVLKAGLKLVKYGQPMINAISAEKERFKQTIPLISQYQPKVIALCVDDCGIPNTAFDRMVIVAKLLNCLRDAGVKEEDIYFDPLVQPISVNIKAAADVIETLHMISREYPKVHKICDLSSVSYGLPNEKILNVLFLAQTIAVGLDSYFLDTFDQQIMGAMIAATALTGEDDYCMEYLKAYHNGLYEHQVNDLQKYYGGGGNGL